ncbi:MAG TPA: antibiotic biosynthesis monooxygenase [Ruminiclostridium sp.]|nr:antibiotic biosynthesis monooxygenase [Ruminiclostridium sp.]
MYIVHVSIKVKKEFIEDFRKASIENARNSIKEPGVARFDVLWQQEDPTMFLLAEAYFTPEDQLRHRDTEHFKKWKLDISDMLEEPYTFIKYSNAYPDDLVWQGPDKIY